MKDYKPKQYSQEIVNESKMSKKTFVWQCFCMGIVFSALLLSPHLAGVAAPLLWSKQQQADVYKLRESYQQQQLALQFKKHHARRTTSHGKTPQRVFDHCVASAITTGE